MQVSRNLIVVLNTGTIYIFLYLMWKVKSSMRNFDKSTGFNF